MTSAPVTSADDRQALSALDYRLRTILPEEYQDTYEEIRPAPMKSAGLKFDADGKVAWDEIWGSFCDLAMAGGPPHKGRLLEPGTSTEIARAPDRYREVADEIRRGITLATDLRTPPSPHPGWVRVEALNEGMAGWLLRAIVMENVAVRCEGSMIDLPAAPHFRLEKEIKNVVTVMAKTCHYWLGHMPLTQRRRIAHLFALITAESPLIVPAASAAEGTTSDAHDAARAALGEAIERATGLAPSAHRYAGWLGVVCPDVRAAIWMMRALVVGNVLARREETVLFVPIDPAAAPRGEAVAGAVARVHALAAVRGILTAPA